MVSDGTNWRELSRQPTASTFIKLSDAPTSYTGQAYKLTRVNSGESALEFVSLTSIAENSIEEDTGTHKFRLNGDTASPGDYKFYGTNAAGARGWYDNPLFPHGIDIFTSSGTWTKPSGVTKCYVKVWGGGGGAGSGGGTSGAGGDGGGAGGYAEGQISVTGNVTVTVGAGGVSSGDGTDGGTSSFVGTTTIQATGGEGGESGNDTKVAGRSDGGVGTGGILNLTGEAGQLMPNLPTAGPGGDGGGAWFNGRRFGRGHQERDVAVAGGSASANSGAGGGGGGGGTGWQAAAGGAGGSGLVIVYY